MVVLSTAFLAPIPRQACQSCRAPFFMRGDVFRRSRFLLAKSTSSSSSSATNTERTRIIVVPEEKWRQDALNHVTHIRSLLAPGLTDAQHVINSGRRRQQRRQQQQQQQQQQESSEKFTWTALDPKHPVYNFFIEYYGLKGAKGPRRLARWSPDPALLLARHPQSNSYETPHLPSFSSCVEMQINLQDSYLSKGLGPEGGILLQGATMQDLQDTLHLKGAVPFQQEDAGLFGMLYSPALYYQRYTDDFSHHVQDSITTDKAKAKTAAPFQWYQTILQTTHTSTPILHCHGLHEWAMQYHPHHADPNNNTPPPPSSKYQAHLPLRVTPSTICQTVEAKGIHCTHVDALRFFAPEAGKWNHHGAVLEREEQAILEQKGCVHAHMDLLKMALRLQPFVNPTRVQECLQVALAARKLDVEASPYDASEYGLGVVAVETLKGREEYRRRQKELMEGVEPVRERLLGGYEVFLDLAFGLGRTTNGVEEEEEEEQYVGKERLARAFPGSPPWRRNLIEEES